MLMRTTSSDVERFDQHRGDAARARPAEDEQRHEQPDGDDDRPIRGSTAHALPVLDRLGEML